MTRYFLFAFLICVFGSSSALAGRRVALVIGNSKYRNLTCPPNPAPDAKEVARLLHANGYEVLDKYDVTRENFLDALESFRRSYLNGASEALVFYAGHGMSAEGRDVLAPVDCSYQCDEVKGEDEREPRYTLGRCGAAIARRPQPCDRVGRLPLKPLSALPNARAQRRRRISRPIAHREVRHADCKFHSTWQRGCRWCAGRTFTLCTCVAANHGGASQELLQGIVR